MAARTAPSRSRLVVGACVAAALLFVAYARFGVDYGALVAAHDANLREALISHSVNVENLSAKLARFHKGPPPCEYAPMQEVPQEEVDVIARELRGAKMLGRAAELSPLFFRWGKDDEDRRHGPRSDDEVLTAWNATGSLYDRAVAAIAPHGVAEAVRASTDRTRAQVLAKAEEKQRGMSEHEVESLYGIWVRHPVALSAPAFVQTLTRLPKE
jgi:hypothetical protein